MSQHNSSHKQATKRKANTQPTPHVQSATKKFKQGEDDEGERKRHLTDQSLNTTTHGTPFQSSKKLKMNGKVNNLRKKPVKKLTIKGLEGTFPLFFCVR